MVTPDKMPTSTYVILVGTSAVGLLLFLGGVSLGEYFTPTHTNTYCAVALWFSSIFFSVRLSFKLNTK